MSNFGNIIYRTETKAYVIKDNTYTVPHPNDATVPAEIHAEFDTLWHEIDAYAKANPDKVTEEGPYVPSEEEIAAQELAHAKAQATSLLTSRMMASVAQTSSFTTSEFSILAKAHIFEPWLPGQTYSAGFRLEHEGVVYEVVQEVTSIENQPPSAAGMLAIYRPLSVDAETGEEPDGTKDHPYTYLHGMDVVNGSYYTFDGKLWLAKADMPACVWDPGTEGLWQWEEVEALE